MLGADELREIGDQFLQVVQRHTGRPFPSDPYEQLEIAIKAVFNSWMGKRADRTTGAVQDHAGWRTHRRQRAYHGFATWATTSATDVGLHAQPRHGREPALREY